MTMMKPRLAHLALLGTPMLLASLATQAQNTPRYSMTALGLPFGATHSAAFSLDANGTARGSVNTVSTSITFCGSSTGVDLFDFFPKLCKGTRSSAREATWPVSTASVQSPTLGTSNFVALAAATDGTIVGTRGVLQAAETTYWNPVQSMQTGGYSISHYNSTTPWRLTTQTNNPGAAIGIGNKSLVLKKASKITNIPFPPSTGLQLFSLTSYYNAQVRGLTNKGVALVNAFTYEAATSVPYLFDGTRYTKLNDSLARSRLMGTAMNEQGAVAGVRFVAAATGELSPAVVPVRWVNGSAVELGGSELRGYVPEAINNNGQILLHRTSYTGDVTHEAAVWSNGVLTPIPTPPDGAAPPGVQQPYGLIPVAINNRGDVVGCGAFPFVWRDGILHNLNQSLTANGQTTPNGKPLDCVSAINDQGVMLANYPLLKSAAYENHVGWVRLTPLP